LIMKISEILRAVEDWAPSSLKEGYDNVGLQVGDAQAEVRSALLVLDCTEAVVQEAVERGCQLVISHHPAIFKGLTKLTGTTTAERAVMAAVRHNVALLAVHTNLDHVADGVNGMICERLGLLERRTLSPRADVLLKLVTFVPEAHIGLVRAALFAEGAGHLGRYSECSFGVAGMGTFLPGHGSRPFVGELGKAHQEKEVRLEVLMPRHLKDQVVQALLDAHPYEEAAYDLYPLLQSHPGIGAGMVGQLPDPCSEGEFLARLKKAFGARVVRHSAITGRQVGRVAVCGGSGSFLLPEAMACGADVFVTADVSYHRFFEPEGRLLLADIGHWESEQFTVPLIADRLRQLFPTFAVLSSERSSNPIHYF
jgi:dinuclear metal center YbgI/SA1388 family protein